MGRYSEHRGGPEGATPGQSDRVSAPPVPGPPVSAPAQYVLSLESAVGNRATAAILARWRSELRSGVLQRPAARSLQRWPTELPIADGGMQAFTSMHDVFRYLASIPADKAKVVAELLLKTLMPFRAPPPYEAKDEAEQKLATKVQTDLGITFGEWNGLLFEARARLEESPRKPSPIPLSSGPQAPVKNSAEVEQVKAFVKKAGDDFKMLYTDAELDGLVEFSRSVALQEAEFHGIILTGCRERKPRSVEQLKDQMHNWKNVVPAQGRPFKFTDAEHFQRFRVKLTELVASCELPGNIKLPASDIRIQGSSLRTPFADDVDIAVCVTREEYRDICAGRYAKYFVKATGNAPDSVDDVKKITFERMVEMATQATTVAVTDRQLPVFGYKNSGNFRSAANGILSGKFDGKSQAGMPGLYAATEKMKAAFPELKIESVTVIMVGGRFDLQPAMKLDAAAQTVKKD